jgi:hypothetical protein
MATDSSDLMFQPNHFHPSKQKHIGKKKKFTYFMYEHPPHKEPDKIDWRYVSSSCAPAL